jgi:hypothetical protein
MAQKQWMWQDESSGGVRAAVVDFEDRRILWFEEPGCACAGSNGEQSFDDFLKRGARAIMPPDDVLEEMRAALVASA